MLAPMRSSSLAAVGGMSAGLLLSLACGSPQQQCPQPLHPALVSQVIGQPCTGDADCATGLSCLRSSPGFDEAPDWGGLRSCTVRCDAAACATGTTCVARVVESDGGVSRLCLPTCQQDTDCRQGTAAGSCPNDGGVRSCERLTCWDDRQCPAGYGCENSVNACCPPGAMCVRGGLQVGYCRRR